MKVLENNKQKQISVILIISSFVVSIIYSYFLSFTERGLPLSDWFNIAINLLWFCILAWLAAQVHFEKKSAKGNLLFFACVLALLTGFDLFEEDGSLLLAGISTMQALFLFGAYFLVPNSFESKSIE
ncbi:MAG: hypothetical protein AB2687_06895 [Candidatus Thiodiazotropha taylori]